MCVSVWCVGVGGVWGSVCVHVCSLVPRLIDESIITYM